MATIRPKDCTAATMIDDAEKLLIDGSNGVKAITYSNAKTDIAADFVGAPTTFKLCPLDASNKVSTTYMPTGITGAMVYNGAVAAASLPASSTTAGDYYVDRKSVV